MADTVLGLDCGTRTGWAVLRDGQIIDSGVEVFEHLPDEALGRAYRAWIQWASETCAWFGVTILAYERPHYRGACTDWLVGLAAQAEVVAYEQGALPYRVHSATLKKFATGNGRADKAAMVEAARPFTDHALGDDEADAIHVARWAAQTHTEGE